MIPNVRKMNSGLIITVSHTSTRNPFGDVLFLGPSWEALASRSSGFFLTEAQIDAVKRSGKG